MLRVTGVDIEPFIDGWFWDGKAEADEIFSEELKDATGHVCLQHG